MKNFIIQTYTFLITYCLLLSCNNIDNFSGDNSILDFQIKDIATKDVVLSTHSIDKENNTITLLSYRVHSFPIDFTYNITLSNSDAHVVDLPDTIQLKAPDQKIVFHIIAANGATAKWQIQMKTISKNSDADLLNINITSGEKYISTNAVINSIDTTVYIVTPECNFPMGLGLTCQLSDSATLKNYTNGDILTFESYSTTHKIEVKAADGLIKTWKIELLKPNIIEDNYSVSWSQWQKLSFLPSQTNINASAEVYKKIIDVERNKILCILEDDIFPNNFHMSLSSTLQEGIELLGYQLNSDIKLTDNTDFIYTYLLDNTTLNAKKWTIKASEKLSPNTNIKDILLLSSTPASIKIDFNNILIDNNNAVIMLQLIEGIENLPLDIRILAIADSGATIYGGKECKIDIKYNTLSDIYNFSILAEDGYTERQWSILCVNSDSYKQQANVLSANIVSYSSREDRMILKKATEINHINKTISVSITDWSEYFPLDINFAFSLSYGATISNIENNNALRFENINDTHKFIVKSNDGSLSNEYSIILKDDVTSVRNEAQLISFEAKGLASGYEIENINISQTNNIIDIFVSQKGVNIFSFIPKINISTGASLLGINNGKRFYYGEMTNVHSFKIISEDKSVTKIWTINVKYHPQIANSNLDKWIDMTTPSIWSTANNSFGKNTEQVSNNNGFAAKMATKDIIGNIAAGSLFLGEFVMNLSYISNPRMMTFFGMPFTERPIALEFDYTYSSPVDDEGSAVVELLNFSDENVEYHGIGNETGATVLYRGIQYLNDNPTWKRTKIDIQPINTSLPITHIHIVFSSSYKGEELQGDKGAILTVDNIRLIY